MALAERLGKFLWEVQQQVDHEELGLWSAWIDKYDPMMAERQRMDERWATLLAMLHTVFGVDAEKDDFRLEHPPEEPKKTPEEVAAALKAWRESKRAK